MSTAAAEALTDPRLSSTGVPPVLRRGRHRDTALAAWRRSEAIRLKTSGMTYQQVADQLGYANRGTVCRIVHRALDAREVDSADLHRQVQHDRLEILHSNIWPKAMQGHVPSVLAALRIIEQQMRLLGLYPDRGAKDPKADWPSCIGPATVVIHPDDCRHKGCPTHGSFEDLTPRPPA